MAESETTEAVDSASPASDSDRLLPADSESTPHVSLVLTAIDGPDDLERAVTRFADVLEKAEGIGELIVGDTVTEDVLDAVRDSGASVVTPDGEGDDATIRAAFEQARGDYLAIVTGGGRFQTGILLEILSRLVDGADVVVGRTDPAEEASEGYGSSPMYPNPVSAGQGERPPGLIAMRRTVLGELGIPDSVDESLAASIAETARSSSLSVEVVTEAGGARDEGGGVRNLLRAVWSARADLLAGSGLLGIQLGVLIIAISIYPLVIAGQGFGDLTMVGGMTITLVSYQLISLGMFAQKFGAGLRETEHSQAAWLVKRLSLRRGVVLGGLLFVVGVMYAAYRLHLFLVVDATVGAIRHDLLGLTAIILGGQIIVDSIRLYSRA